MSARLALAHGDRGQEGGLRLLLLVRGRRQPVAVPRGRGKDGAGADVHVRPAEERAHGVRDVGAAGGHRAADVPLRIPQGRSQGLQRLPRQHGGRQLWRLQVRVCEGCARRVGVRDGGQSEAGGADVEPAARGHAGEDVRRLLQVHGQPRERQLWRVHVRPAKGGALAGGAREECGGGAGAGGDPARLRVYAIKVHAEDEGGVRQVRARPDCGRVRTVQVRREARRPLRSGAHGRHGLQGRAPAGRGRGTCQV
mmetsp:Transcript_14716/g.43917  ORF Transcript_14716/g.43917 Transcript_14716/m.43917 type:complete len:253 (-) Transcript_14716:830-1588(-)